MHGGSSVVLWLPLALLDALLLHRQWAVHVVQLVVQTAGVAHGISLVVAPPQGCRVCLAIGTGDSIPPIVGGGGGLGLRLALGHPWRHPHKGRTVGTEVLGALSHERRVAVLALQFVVRRRGGRGAHQTSIVLADAAGGSPVGGGHVARCILINHLRMEISLKWSAEKFG